MGKSRRAALAVFASGSGSNAERLMQESHSMDSSFRVALVVGNNSSARVMTLATMYDIPTAHISSKTHPDEAERDAALLQVLQEHGIDLIALAGYMKKLPEAVTQKFARRILNVHPALLPKHGGRGMFGKHVHAAVLEAGETETGVTIHYVNEEYDAGAIIAQERVSVLADDDVDTLAARVLAVEHELYPRVVKQIAAELPKDSV